jgi:hypothetical protein
MPQLYINVQKLVYDCLAGLIEAALTSCWRDDYIQKTIPLYYYYYPTYRPNI